MYNNQNTNEIDDQNKQKYSYLNSLGSVWCKFGKTRVYLNEKTLEKLGYEWSKYKTGNISSASLNGNHISNCEMKRVLYAFEKVFIEIEERKIVDAAHNGGLYEWQKEKILEIFDKLTEEHKNN